MTRRFDAIVVGSGLGGLTAGALYARTGRRILVLERNDSFGGAATVYQHDGLAIEASLHEMDGLDEGDAKTPLLHSLGLDRKLPFVDVGDLYEVRGPLIGAPFALPHGMDAAYTALAARFPRHADALHAYFQRIAAVREAVRFAGTASGRPRLVAPPRARSSPACLATAPRGACNGQRGARPSCSARTRRSRSRWPPISATTTTTRTACPS